MHQASSRSSLVFAVIALLAFSGAARADNGVTPVIVQNPVTLNPAAPNPVTVANPGDIAKAMRIQHPFEFAARAAWSGNVCAVTAIVPAKQRAVIEFITATAGVPATTPAPGFSFFTHTDVTLASPEINPFGDGTGGSAVPQFLLLPPGADEGNGDKDYGLVQIVRAYADPGTTISLDFSIPIQAPTPDRFCFISMSGQLIDVP
jgi:hypothetical protein